MGDKTAIEWCHATFNPWWGCVEVSPGCDRCYARELAKRYGHAVWGRDAPRRFFSDLHWNEPFRWNRKAREAGGRHRVFCASMADVLEDRDDVVGQQLTQARQRLWSVIANTPSLDWLLLTKRPQNYRRLLPAQILALPNVWPGTTVESPDYLWRLEELLKVPALGHHWVSYEPALAFVDFGPFFSRGLAWLLIGGESGGHSRPFDVRWPRRLIAQCRSAGVAPFVKQLGACFVTSYYDEEYRALYAANGWDWPDPFDWDIDDGQPPVSSRVRIKLGDRMGGDMSEWPSDLRVREFPRGGTI